MVIGIVLYFSLLCPIHFVLQSVHLTSVCVILPSPSVTCPYQIKSNLFIHHICETDSGMLILQCFLGGLLGEWRHFTAPLTFRIVSLSILLLSTGYCAPVWSRSPHVKKVDVAFNSSLQIVSGCLKPTPVFYLPVLAGIAPARLRQKAATIALARKAVKHDWHILHDMTKNEVPPCRLKSRKPYTMSQIEIKACGVNDTVVALLPRTLLYIRSPSMFI